MSQVTKDSYDAFLADVLTRVPEELRGEAERIFGQEGVSATLRDAVLARSDYSRRMDELSTDRDQFMTEVEEARRRIEGWTDWYGQTSQEVNGLKTQLDRYQDLFGSLDDLDNDPDEPTTPTETKMPQTALTQEDVQAMLAQRDQMAIKFADVLTDLKLDYQQKFGERLNTEEVIALATRDGVPLTIAYREFIAPREQERAEKAMQDKLAAAREEGRREALTQHRLPVGPPRSEPHVLDATDVKKDPRDRVSAAVAAFNASIAR